MKRIIILALGIIVFSSCNSQSSNRKENGEEWIKSFAKEQFGEKAKYLVSFDIISADKDSSVVTYKVVKNYNGEVSSMNPIKVHFNDDGSIDDISTRQSLGI